MSEETTRNLPDDGVRLILARLDSIDSRLTNLELKVDGLEQKVDGLEQKIDARSYDTKPIWEQALKEIVETRGEVVKIRERLESVERRLGNLEGEMKDSRRLFHQAFRDVTRRQDDIEERLDKFEGREAT